MLEVGPGLGSLTIGLLMATHGGLAVASSVAQEKVANLEKALESNREIGVAIGILVNSRRCTQEQAFGLLRQASQSNHRKLAAVAADVTFTGVLEEAVSR